MNVDLLKFDDLRVVSHKYLGDNLFTLFAILRNEMYFLPAFLKHYRKLGVERFVFLDDCSDDGSREYILSQPDVVVVESNHKYGDNIELPEIIGEKLILPRILYIWRALLHEKFAKDRWALQVDLDEFIHLPKNTKFQDLLPELEIGDARVVWGVMLDMYPQRLSDLVAGKANSRIDLNADWYFDGEEHLEFRNNGTPTMIHPGARARLYQKYGVSKHFHDFGLGPKLSFFSRMKKTRFGHRILAYNQLQKPVLTKWQQGGLYFSSHKISFPASDRFLLPLQHFRFTGSIYVRLERALREKSYSGGSRDYVFMAKLMENMKRMGGSFLYQRSRRFNSFSDLVETLNAKGF
ncbi:glycosyltransferase family 2 protein [Roseibium album]|uniref:glycosyltransferase family 2 protein n=1 Tax=Roseibium album TaxID=311410 RepID=UPI00391DFB8D